jgi:hypothetical protein
MLGLISAPSPPLPPPDEEGISAPLSSLSTRPPPMIVQAARSNRHGAHARQPTSIDVHGHGDALGQHQPEAGIGANDDHRRGGVAARRKGGEGLGGLAAVAGRGGLPVDS